MQVSISKHLQRRHFLAHFLGTRSQDRPPKNLGSFKGLSYLEDIWVSDVSPTAYLALQAPGLGKEVREIQGFCPAACVTFLTHALVSVSKGSQRRPHGLTGIPKKGTPDFGKPRCMRSVCCSFGLANSSSVFWYIKNLESPPKGEKQ